jgi:hypothetical protein
MESLHTKLRNKRRLSWESGKGAPGSKRSRFMAASCPPADAAIVLSLSWLVSYSLRKIRYQKRQLPSNREFVAFLLCL